MVKKACAGILCAAAVALALASCGPTAIPDEEVVGLAGAGTAGTGGDLLALRVFGSGAPAPNAFGVSATINVPLLGSLTYDYVIDYLDDDVSVDPAGDTWDEMTLDGSATLIVDIPDFASDTTLTIAYDITGFNDSPNDGRVIVNGSSEVEGSAMWTNPHTDAAASYTMVLTKTWTDVNIDDPSEIPWTGHPSSGTIVMYGFIDRHSDGPSGSRTGTWEGTISITFDGDNDAAVVVNGRSYLLDLSTGEVTPAP